MDTALNTILTLAARELRVLPRRSKWRLKRALVVFACAAILFVPYLTSALHASVARGLALFQFLCPIAVLLAVFTAPIMAGTSVAYDREAHTLELLCLTPATSWQLIVGRVVGAMSQASLIVLALLPLLMLCVSMGGVAVVQILLACLLVLSVIFAGSCLGILVALATPSRWPQEMAIMVFSAIYFVGLPMALLGLSEGLYPNLESTAVATTVILSPALSVKELVTAGTMRIVVLNIASMFGMGVMMTLLACRLLRRRIILGDAMAAIGSKKTTRASRQFEGNPIRERDLHCAYHRARSGWLIVALMLAIAIGGILMASITHTPLDSGEFEDMFGLMLGLGIFLWGFLFVWRCAHAFSLESRQGVVDMMLLSDMDPMELEEGKRGAIMDSLVPAQWATMLALIGFLCVLDGGSSGSGEDHLFAIFWVLYAVLSAYAGGCLAIYLSLRIGRFAFIVCLASLVGVLFIHAFGMLPISALAALMIYFPFVLLSDGSPPSWIGTMALFVGAVVQLAILVGVSYLFRLHTRFHLQQMTHRTN